MAKKNTGIAIFDDGNTGPSEAMKAAAKTAANDIQDDNKPRIHLCGGNSPEVVREKICEVGEFYVRNAGYSLGKEFTAVVVGSSWHWIYWTGEDDDRKIVWDYEDGFVPVDLIGTHCEWRPNPNGGKDDLKPLANKTLCLVLQPIDKNGIDPRGYVCAGVDRTSVKAGKTMMSQVAKEVRDGWHPSCVVLKFFSIEKSSPKYVWQGWASEYVGHVGNEEVQNKLIGAYDDMKASIIAARQAQPSLLPVSDNAPDSVKKYLGNESQVDIGDYGTTPDSVRNQFDQNSDGPPEGSDELADDPSGAPAQGTYDL